MNLEARVVVRTVVVFEAELVTHYLLTEFGVVVEGHVFEQIPEYKKYPAPQEVTHLTVFASVSFWKMYIKSHLKHTVLTVQLVQPSPQDRHIFLPSLWVTIE